MSLKKVCFLNLRGEIRLARDYTSLGIRATESFAVIKMPSKKSDWKIRGCQRKRQIEGASSGKQLSTGGMGGRGSKGSTRGRHSCGESVIR